MNRADVLEWTAARQHFEVTNSIKDCSGVLDTLDKLIDKVSKEQQLKESIQRGGGEGGFFESK